jgi:hypothetical protein
VYQPTPTGVRFFASDFFFYVANGIGLVSWNGRWEGSWAEFAAAGRAFCGRRWDEVASKYAADFCFGSAYVPALLGAYGIPADSTAGTYVRELAGLWHLVQSSDDVAFVERTTARRRLPLPRGM